MYEVDWWDDLYMEYRQNHPIDKDDKKFILKVFAGIIALFVFTYLKDNGYLYFRDATPTVKEIQNNKQNQINSADTIKFNAIQNTQKTR